MFKKILLSLSLFVVLNLGSQFNGLFIDKPDHSPKQYEVTSDESQPGPRTMGIELTS
ncbi:hypothetical protein GCM10011389_41450 [Pontibacillus salipaludis]|uniref:Uncharacterized protein n=1 Tax=Pontibacillus salipaludis TaxID=1697394 RepID=A0ABQ1QJ74_9BACI|nr:hypothetical protein GCM10011389_41450 [Pontibacillus salipaludis]